MTRFFLILIFTLAAAPVFSQTKKIDSLRVKVQLSKTLAERKNTIISLLSLHRSMNADTLLRYTNYLKNISGKEDQAASLTADIYYAYHFSKSGLLDTSLKITEQGIHKSASIKNVSLLVHFTYIKAVIRLKKNNHKEALTGFFNTLKLAEKYHDTTFQIRALNGIGWVYLEMNQPAEALQWLSKALRVTTNKNYENLYSVVYLNLTPCYGMMGKLDSAEHFEELAFQTAEKYDDLLTKANALALKTNLLNLSGNLEKALQTIKQSIVIRKVLNDPFYIVSDMATMANIYANMQAPEKGIPLAKEAIAIARKHNLQSKLLILYNALASNYEEAGDYKNLAATLQQRLDLKDSVYQKAKAEDLAEIQAKYETEKKEAAIKLLQKENELKDIRNRNSIYFASGILIIILGSSVFFYSFLKIKQKKKIAEERAMMESMRLQAVIQTQENERKRISAELHDGIGPVLSAVKLNIGQLEYSEKDAQKHEKAMLLLDQSYKELRNISHLMMPVILMKSGMVAALNELANNINSSGILRILVDSDNEKYRYGDTLEINLYRIVQELVNNIVKYSGATEAQIQLTRENDEITLMIEDNGDGYETKSLHASGGHGWSNITSRLRIIGGNIEIDTKKGKKGTVVFITVPLQKA